MKSLVDLYAEAVARKGHYKFLRSDRGATEFVATGLTPKEDWGEAREIRAYTIGSCIFWPDVKASKQRVHLRHELTHVRQSQQYGALLFPILYWIEDCVHGYRNNRFEVEARAASR